MCYICNNCLDDKTVLYVHVIRYLHVHLVKKKILLDKDNL